MEELIQKIKERGYWKIIIRPAGALEEKRIKTRDDCEKIIEECKISLTGWDYPHIDPEKRIYRSGPDSVSSFSNWAEGSHVEYWKLYQNGQFVHYFSMKEDYAMDKEEKEGATQSFPFSKPKATIDRFLSVLRTLYSVTEIYFFAANLSRLAYYGEKTQIIIELGNTKGRTLFFWGSAGFRELYEAYSCEYEPITEEITIPTKQLKSEAAALSLNATMNIFKEFNWKNPSSQVFQEDQRKLLAGKF